MPKPVSRILYGVAAADGHSSRPVITDRLKRPTRKFDASSRDVFWISLPGIPSLFGLAPCGVCHASSITARAVRSYRTFSPLPQPLNISGSAGLRLLCLCVRRKSGSAFAVHFSPRVPQRLAPASTLASGSSWTVLTVRSPGRRRYILCGTFRRAAPAQAQY
jgi:hypothetical protein